MNYASLSKWFIAISIPTLLLSFARGWYSYDFFTLWGIHPKLVWSFGDLGLLGNDTLVNLSYHSILGTILGGLMRLVGVVNYVDWPWVIGIFFLNITFLYLLISQTTKRFDSLVLWLVFILSIPATTLGQQMFGGYLDLLGALVLALGIIYFDKGRIYRTSLLFFALVLIKPTLWPWIVIFLGSNFLAKPSSIKKFSIYAIPVGASVLAYGLLKAWYSGSGSASPLFLSVQLLNLSPKYLLHLFAYPFITFSGALLFCLIFLIKQKKEGAREVIYFFLGSLKIYLIYFLLFASSDTEKFPSIKRYTLMMAVPLIALCIHKFSYRMNKKLILLFGLILLLVRVPESVNHIKKFKGFSVCEIYPRHCQLAKQNVVESNSHCVVELISENWENQNLEGHAIDFLVYHYLSLPNRYAIRVGQSIPNGIKKMVCEVVERN